MQSEEELFFQSIAAEGKLLSKAQVEECLEIQKQSPNPSNLWGLMVEKGYINASNLDAISAKAPSTLQKKVESKTDKRFGELCIERGFATELQIRECLDIQARFKREGKHMRIGQILIEKKYVALRQAQVVLELQGKKILRCSQCETKYNIKRYQRDKTYKCPKCDSELVSSQHIASSINVERSFVSRDSVDVDDEALSLLHKKIGNYEIVEHLGEGGMADVYKVESKKKRPRALKIMKQQAGFERFNREFESAHALRHPNIIRVFETGKFEGRPYFFMELLEGGTLSKRIEKMGIIPVPEALSILKQVTLGLKYAHENNIVHRDIKPSNILLSRDSNKEIIAKIADFGIARVPTDHQITMTGQLLGTFKYMSPEQIKTQNIDGKADIFSLGIVAFEMLTGHEPFNVETTVGYLFVNIKETPPLVSQINPDLPKALGDLVNKMLAKDPKNRYDATSLLRDIDRLINHLNEGTKLYEVEDKTSVFYSKGPLNTIKGMFGKLFSRNDKVDSGTSEIDMEHEEKQEPVNFFATEIVDRESSAEKQYEFAMELLMQGKVENAKKQLQALIEVFPGSSWAIRARNKLRGKTDILPEVKTNASSDADKENVKKKKQSPSYEKWQRE